MSAARIDQALTRIAAAIERIGAARPEASAALSSEQQASADAPNSARVMALVNAHEKLREEVADTIGELDSLIEELEG